VVFYMYQYPIWIPPKEADLVSGFKVTEDLSKSIYLPTPQQLVGTLYASVLIVAQISIVQSYTQKYFQA